MRYFMHCRKCWEYIEEANHLKVRSSQKLTDWSNLIAEIPEHLSSVCEENIRDSILYSLENMPRNRFSFKDWWEFLNDTCNGQGTDFIDLALDKLEDTVETAEDKANYQRIYEVTMNKLGKRKRIMTRV